MKKTTLLSAVSLVIAAALVGAVPGISSAQDYQEDTVIDTDAPPEIYDSTIDSAPGSPLYQDDSTINSAPGTPLYQDDSTIDSAPGSPLYQDDTTIDSAPGSPIDEDKMEDMKDEMDDQEDLTEDTSRSSRDAAAGSAVGPWRDRTGSNYLMLKGGAYHPSKKGDLDNIQFNKHTGFAGEVAAGRYLLPFLAVELGAGYFQSKNSPALPAGSNTMLRVVPLVATGKAFLPLGVFEPYGLFGIGAYISDVDVRHDTTDFDGETDVTFGFHAGAGFNINVSDTTFFGLEGKYLWAEPELGGRDINLDGYITTIDVGFRF